MIFNNFARIAQRTKNLGFLCALLMVHRVDAILDYTGEGVSEVWKASHPGVVPDGSDLDGDGFSNYEESVAGTDPSNADDYLALKLLPAGPGEAVMFEWQSVAGKAYAIEQFNSEAKSWEKALSIFPEQISRVRQVSLTLSKGIFRLSVKDIDVDRDGLNGWEEVLLGMSDHDPLSGNRTGGTLRTDFASTLQRLASPDGLVLTNRKHMPQKLPSQSEASRFLIKASFGPTDELIAEVAKLGFVGWIDRQMAMTPTDSATLLVANGYPDLSDAWRFTWWRLVNTAPDQLRQRIAYALSQILVVSFQGGTLVGSHPILQAHYYDFFINHSEQTYRELLQEVTYSPVMGWYLSHLQNRKADPEINRFPDENFAREIMQLFTIGLWELNSDGSQKLDEFGDPIATYRNREITEMARVFTGMGFSTTNSGKDLTTWFFNAGVPPVDWQNPMRFFPEEHDQGAKTIISGVEIPAGQEGDNDVAMALDALCNHPSSAPFLSRLLIQRFTSSNPSPAYVSRVVSTWKATGGRLDRVVEAILLDPEALFQQRGDTLGKLREPIIRFAHFSRAFKFHPANSSSWALEYHNLNRAFGQYGGLSPSVFNFYLPEFSPQGELRARGLQSPESEIATFSNLISSNNYYLSALEQGYNGIVGDYSVIKLLEANTDHLLDYLDLLLTGGTLTPQNRARIATAVDQMYTPIGRIEAAIHLMTQCPEFTVVK